MPARTALNEPYDSAASLTMAPATGMRVTRFTAPPTAPSPDISDAGPLRISMRSRLPLSITREVMLAGPILMPLYSVLIWLLAKPRIENAAGSAGKSPASTPTAACAASVTLRMPRSRSNARSSSSIEAGVSRTLRPRREADSVSRSSGMGWSRLPTTSTRDSCSAVCARDSGADSIVEARTTQARIDSQHSARGNESTTISTYCNKVAIVVRLRLLVKVLGARPCAGTPARFSSALASMLLIAEH